MDTGIHFQGGKVTKQAVDAVAYAVETVFRAGHEYRMDQDTVRAALDIVAKMGVVQNCTISNCHVQG